MEALVLIFGEIVFAFLAPFVMLIVDAVATLAGFILSYAFDWKIKRPSFGRIARIVSIALAGIAGVLFIGILLANSLFFDRTVRMVFTAAHAKTGVETQCQTIEGSLFAGRVRLGDCTIQRAAHPTSTFDMHVDLIEVDLQVSSLLGKAKIESARVSGLTGAITSTRSDTDAPVRNDKPKRQFVVRRLDVSDVRLELTGTNRDGNPFQLPIEIERFESQPLRSRLALFDGLFRSNAAGTIDGAPFEITTTGIEDGRTTKWRATELPVASLGAVAGGALSWFKSGSVDVSVDDRWRLGEAVDINMGWRLELKDIEVGAPAGTGTLKRIAAAPLTRYVNSLDRTFPLEFDMVVNENQFEYQSSLASTNIWSAVGQSVNDVLGAFGVNMEGDTETGNAIRDSAKSVLDTVRKRKPEDSD